MKKTLLACALTAGLSGVTYAQSNVTIYGIMDLGYTYRDADGEGTTNKLDSGIAGGSRIGFRGTEDLGNGLKVNFRLETGVDADIGRAAQGERAFGRAAWLSLAGGFGELRIGRQNALGYEWFGGTVSPWGTNFMQANPKTVFGYDDIAERLDNAVFYYSPTFAGFQAAIGYSTQVDGQEGIENYTDNTAISAGLMYKNGPLKLALTYDQKNVSDAQDDVAGNNFDDVHNIAIGGSYDFGGFKLHAGYGQLENIGFNGSKEKEKSWLIGASLPVGSAGELMATYQTANEDRNINKYGAAFDEDVKGFAVVYAHKLSKRTKLYAYGSQYQDVVRDAAKNKLGDATEFAVGINHSF
ncbi:MAG: porin [Azoarcus sp.]|nr:porin [Azoarcus sp.]